MIAKLLRSCRQLELLTEPKLTDEAEAEVSAKLYDFIDRFLAFHELDESQIVKLLYNFLGQHMKNIRRFQATEKYPYELDGSIAEVDRVEYELALLLSTVTTYHRYRLMELIEKSVASGHQAVVVGCGPGLEIELIKSRFTEVQAYDLEISAFCRQVHSDVDLQETIFLGQRRNVDAIFLIEILEHLDNPFDLIDLSLESLGSNGRIYLTTITNEPQFDHIYNFRPEELHEYTLTRGFQVHFHERISHKTRRKELLPANDFYSISL